MRTKFTGYVDVLVADHDESVVEDYLKLTTSQRGGWCVKIKDLGRRGAPDRELRMPGGRIIYVETKRPRGGVLKPWQERYAASLRSLGFDVKLLTSKGQIDDFWRSYDSVYG